MGKQELLTAKLKISGNTWIPLFVPFRKFYDADDQVQYGKSIIHELNASRSFSSPHPCPPWYPPFRCYPPE